MVYEKIAKIKTENIDSLLLEQLIYDFNIKMNFDELKERTFDKRVDQNIRDQFHHTFQGVFIIKNKEHIYLLHTRYYDQINEQFIRYLNLVLKQYFNISQQVKNIILLPANEEFNWIIVNEFY